LHFKKAARNVIHAASVHVDPSTFTKKKMSSNKMPARDKNGRFLPSGKASQKRTKPKKSTVSSPSNQATAVMSRKQPSITPITQMLGNPSAPAVETKIVNRVAFVIDSSGSMSGLNQSVISAINSQIAQAKTLAHDNQQSTFISRYTFSNAVVCDEKDAYYQSAGTMISYYPSGGTALFDAIGQAVSDLRNQKAKPGENLAYLVFVITDGQENQSRTWDKSSIAQLIRDCQAQGNWTFAISGPAGTKHYFSQFGVPIENIQEWEATVQGTYKMATANNTAYSTYSAVRSTGGQSVSCMYTTTANDITSSDLKKLTDVTANFTEIPVTADSQISNFVDSVFSTGQYPSIVRKHGSRYQPGRAYYELVKTENLQNHKDIIVKNMTTGKLYSGPEARALVGINEKDTTCKVTPGNNGKYKIYVKSTSMNRKLTPGTVLLYESN
jgi:Mg-chelatase subunit ChlD